MAELDSLAFEPGQQVQCETRFKDVFKGEVVAFDLNSNILIIKSPSTSGNNAQHDLHFLVLDSVADVKLLEEQQHGDSSNDLPSIDMKSISLKKDDEIQKRRRLIQAVECGVSLEGISLFTVISKTLHRPTDIAWKDKVKIVVMNAVVISPPYKESDCASLDAATKDSVTYVKNIVRKFWDTSNKQ